MRAKQFMYVCAGILMLAVAYAIGANTVQGQARSPIVGFTNVSVGLPSIYPGLYAVLENGDVVYSLDGNTWAARGNVYGGTVAVEGTTITDVKKKFREEEQ